MPGCHTPEGRIRIRDPHSSSYTISKPLAGEIEAMEWQRARDMMAPPAQHVYHHNILSPEEAELLRKQGEKIDSDRYWESVDRFSGALEGMGDSFLESMERTSETIDRIGGSTRRGSGYLWDANRRKD